MENPTSPAPTMGPAMLPSRNPVAHSPDARPRSGAGVSRISRPTAATVNMVEPTPATERNTSSIQKWVANPHAPVATATIRMPAT